MDRALEERNKLKISVLRPGELGPGEIAVWLSMQRQTPALANPFLCPDFTVAVGALRPSARVAALHDGTQLAGFFPFERRGLGVGTPIAHGLNQCQGLIHAPGAEWDPKVLLRACRLEEEVGKIRFVGDSNDKAALNRLVNWKSEQLRQKGALDILTGPWITGLLDQLLSIKAGHFRARERRRSSER